MTQVSDLTFSGYQPGGLAKLCAMQTEYYAREWGFNHLYESVVASDIGEFLQRYNADRDFVQLVLHAGEVKGGIVIDSQDGKLAQLHWFILHNELKGLGVGKMLIKAAMQFIKARGFPQVYLTTFEGLNAARHLYEAAGFILAEEQLASTWGRTVKEQRFEWTGD
ncbi:GNAT family N-acetyltransferase [Porticoccaceae bacterium]|nr:GNAT family N-acetyltransferase [Porticoccaceae bacterium]